MGVRALAKENYSENARKNGSRIRQDLRDSRHQEQREGDVVVRREKNSQDGKRCEKQNDESKGGHPGHEL